MIADYQVRDTTGILSPGLLFYKDLIRRNIARMIEMAGGSDRLRPHVKTHKTREIVRLELQAGITKHKCATLAEAEMAAGCGAAHVLIAYTMVGPNCERLLKLIKTYPACRFAVLGDHPHAMLMLSDVMTKAGQEVEMLLDIDVGQHRTGIEAGEKAIALYESISGLPGLVPGGLHVYDGHNHQESLAERTASLNKEIGPVLQLLSTLKKKGLPVPRVVLGGTPTFALHVRMNVPGGEYSAGTCVLHDDGYASRHPDLTGFTPAALLLTRVISRPTPRRVTFDLGYKAVASDPPAGKRLRLLDVPDAQAVLQNEEHLVIETPAAERFRPGDVAYAMPTHVCPTCAMHRWAYVVEQGKVTDRWEIVARDRMLTI